MVKSNFEDLRMLIIDDDSFMLDTIEIALEVIGVKQVKKASNASDALAAVSDDKQTFDVILCDLYMPDVDGIEFLSRLSRLSFNGKVGIISGAEDFFLSAAQRLGEHHGLKIVGVIKKPITSVALQDLLKAQ